MNLYGIFLATNGPFNDSSYIIHAMCQHGHFSLLKNNCILIILEIYVPEMVKTCSSMGHRDKLLWCLLT